MTIYGHVISNELHNKKRIDIPQPEHTHQVNDKHLKIFERLKDKCSRIMQAREVKFNLLEAEDKRQEETEDPEKLAMLINEIDETNHLPDVCVRVAGYQSVSCYVTHY